MIHPILKCKEPICFISKPNNPSLSYWMKLNEIEYKIIDPTNIKNSNILSEYRTIIIIRTIPFFYLKHIISIFFSRQKIILFLDDDLLNINFSSNLPFFYWIKLFFGIRIFKVLLRFFITDIWVTNSQLYSQTKIAIKDKIPISILPLFPSRKLISSPKIYRLAYLGTSSHVMELKWIIGFLQKFQSSRNDCVVDLIVNSKWRRKFRNIPRLRCFYPMDFETYLLDTSNRKVDILLTPLMESKFNLSRSPVKFFDAIRLGAVGIYSDRLPYKGFIKDGKDGFLLSDSHEDWIITINKILKDDSLSNLIFASSKERALRLTHND